MAGRRPTRKDEEKLKRIRLRFEDAIDHNDHARQEMHRAGRFYYNTRGEGQWPTEERSDLLEEGRPCLTFNVCRDKVRSFLATYADSQRSPLVAASGGEDDFLAEILDTLTQQVLEDTRLERKAARVLKTGTINGQCGFQVEVRPHDEKPGWVSIEVHRVIPYEIDWDSSSIEADRSDAGHFFHHRWMTRSQFERWYPKDANAFDELKNSAADPASDGLSNVDRNGEMPGWEQSTSEHSSDYYSRYYFDRHKNKARVIRYEYKTNVKQHFTVDPTTGERFPITDDQKRELERTAKQFGLPVNVLSMVQERIKVCEFVGNRILAEHDSAGPFKGFSVSDYVYELDEEEGTAHGMLRDLFDPQSELNKSKSLEIETVANGSAPGTVAEENAIPDLDRFKQERRTSNGVAIVENNALSEGRVQERPAYPVSPAVIQRAQSSMDLVDRISGTPSQGNVMPASQAEAATTVALRHHKAHQLAADPIANFEWAVRDTVRKVVEAIVRTMPDDQIAAMLGKKQKYQVEGGRVVEIGPNPMDPNGPPVAVRQADLRMLEGLDWNIELELQTENTTLRVLEFETLTSLQRAGVPVDPEVLVETSTSSRSRQERLKAYVKEVMAKQAQAAQAEAQAAEQSMGQMAAIEAAKAQETARSNQADEALKAQKQRDDRTISLMEVWERADASEKQQLIRLMEMARAESAEAVRGTANTRPL